MRKWLGVTAVAATALLAYGGSTADLLGDFVKALQGGKTLSAQYTLQRIGGTSRALTVSFAKPNMLRVETPTQLIVADGKQITTLEKAANTYYSRAQTDSELQGLLNSEDLAVWSPFFGAKTFDSVAGTKDLGSKTRNGTALRVVEATLDAKGRQVVTLYVAPDGIPRQAEIVRNNPDGKDTLILNAKNVELNGAAGDFTFVAPTGAKQLTEEELMADRWYDNLDEALAVAKRTKRLVMLDFYTDW